MHAEHIKQGLCRRVDAVGTSQVGVGHEKMHDIADLPWQMCANKAWALRNPISVQAVNTTE